MIIFGSPNRNRKQLVAYGNGLLYNWYAVTEATFAPVGWHVPTDAEFTTLANALGGASVAGGKMKSTRTSAPYFESPNTGATDESGFRAFGAGRRTNAGQFTLMNQYGWFLTKSESTIYGISFRTNYNNDDLTLVNNLQKNYGLSVRLLKDDSTWFPGMVVTDKDGNKYATVKIGNQVWLKSNWKCTKYNDGTSIPNVTDNAAWAALTTPGYCSYNNAAISEYTELF